MTVRAWICGRTARNNRTGRNDRMWGTDIVQRNGSLWLTDVMTDCDGLMTLTEFPKFLELTELTELTELSDRDSIDGRIDKYWQNWLPWQSRTTLPETDRTFITFWWWQNINDLLEKQLIINKPIGHRQTFWSIISWSGIYLNIVIKWRSINKLHGFHLCSVPTPLRKCPPCTIPPDPASCHTPYKTENFDLLLSLHINLSRTLLDRRLANFARTSLNSRTFTPSRVHWSPLSPMTP